MKKTGYILAAVMACCGTLTAMAQAETQTDSLRSMVESLTNEVGQLKKAQEEANMAQRINKTWSKSKPLTISYGTQTLNNTDLGIKHRSNLAISVRFMRTYYLHSKPIANLFKVGLDATWLSINYARFKKGNGINLSNGLQSNYAGGTGLITDGNFANMDDYFNQAYGSAGTYGGDFGNAYGSTGTYGDDYDDDYNLGNAFDIGAHSISLNMGIGPNLKFVPFFFKGNPKLDKLKASVYFHWMPGFMTYVSSGDDMEASFGPLLNNFGYGLNISYGRIGIGVEHRFGRTKLNSFSMEDGDEGEGTSNKFNYKIGSTHFYIGFFF